MILNMTSKSNEAWQNIKLNPKILQVKHVPAIYDFLYPLLLMFQLLVK